nr:MAG TPA: hypothetical protein [Caudoviricetes sp.]
MPGGFTAEGPHGRTYKKTFLFSASVAVIFTWVFHLRRVR